MAGIDKITALTIRLLDRHLPEPFTFALLITGITLTLVMLFTDTSFILAVQFWGNGLSMLLEFIAQMALMVFLSYTLANLGPMRRLLEKLSSIPNSATQAYLFIVYVVGIISLIAWPAGLICGGILARHTAMTAKQRDIKIHYPLLAGAAYGGFVVWHMGYSASAPLFVATKGNAMQEQLGEVIPITETIATTWNITLALLTLTVVAFTSVFLHPKNPRLIEEIEQKSSVQEAQSVVITSRYGLAAMLEHHRLITLSTGILLLIYVGHWFLSKGLQLNLNIVNWSLLALILLCCKSAHELNNTMITGGKVMVPIIQQYPLYAGIMGVMLSSGLVPTIAEGFIRIAAAETLPFICFLVAAIVNLFIPSGGAQWTVQGPIFIEAATRLGVDYELIVMSVAYGDQWTNLIHPFSVIILLILTGLKLKQVLSYSAVLFIAAGLPLGSGLLLLPHLL